jgi:class 3 adenylate cyclase/predicted ATPase
MDLGGWLRSLGLEQYEAAFRDNAIDDTVLPNLTAEDLKDLGVVLVGHRRKLLDAIASLRTDLRSNAVPPGVLPTIDQVAKDNAERRHITVMFSDLVDSTALSGRMDPEDLREVISAYQKCASETVRSFGGFVARYMGDGILVYFGYPEAHEDDAERAVRAGLDLIAAVIGLKTHAALQVRVGIATGLVVVGDLIGSTQVQDIVGVTPNLAARLQTIAEPNTVVIADSTRKLLGNLFEFKDLESRNLKGIDGVTQAWAALRARPVESRFEAMHVGGLTALVGRDEETELLLRRWSRAKTSEGQVVLFSGEAGIGKSRLTAALLEHLADQPITRLRYFCSPQHTNTAFYPIVSQMERAAGLAHDDTTVAKLDKLDALLAQTSTSAQDATLFAEMLSLSNGRYPAIEMTPQQRRQRTLEALTAQLKVLTRTSPVLMIFEDVHWIDPTSLEALGRTVDQIRTMRVLLIVTFRPDFDPPWIGRPYVTALTINRLGEHDIDAMIDRIVGNKLLPANIRHDIIERTDGIPLFVEEMTKAVLEVEDEGQARLTAASVPSPALAVPASLHASLMARLDRLGPGKEVAQIGAAIGREFSYALLAAVSTLREIQLQDALMKLVAAELIFVRGAPPTATYVFKHALVQDAAYDTFVRSNRQQLHARIADALGTQFPEMAETQPEILAHHFMQAGLIDRAILWGRKAGDLAIRRSANREAVGHLGRALSLLKSLQESRERDAAELEIRIKLSGPLIATGGYVSPELSENYARASDLCIKLGEDKSAFPVMYGQWVIPYVRGDMKAALEQSEKFLGRSEQQDDVGLQLMGHRIYGSSLVWRGDTEAGCTHLQRALDLYQPEHAQLAYSFSQHPRTAALAHLSLALQHIGHLDQAMEAGWEAIGEAKRFGHFNSVAYSLCFVSLLIMLRRDIESLRKTAGELLQLAEQHNASYWALWAKPMLGWIEAQEGKIESGIRQMHESTEVLGQQRANIWVPKTLLLEAEIIGGVKQYDRAYALLDQAQALIEPLDQRFYEAELHRVRGVVLISEGKDPAAGEASIDRAIEVARRQNSRFLELRATVAKARLMADRGATEEARALLGRVYHSFSQGLNTTDLVEARSVLEELN